MPTYCFMPVTSCFLAASGVCALAAVITASDALPSALGRLSFTSHAFGAACAPRLAAATSAVATPRTRAKGRSTNIGNLLEIEPLKMVLPVVTTHVPPLLRQARIYPAASGLSPRRPVRHRRIPASHDARRLATEPPSPRCCGRAPALKTAASATRVGEALPF